MKVLLIDVYNYRRGGAESVCFNTAELLEKNGHETIRFTLKWNDNEPSPYQGYFPESKETRKGPMWQPKNLFNYFDHREAAKKLDQLLADHKPDIAHIHLMWGQITGSILPVLKRHNVPVVYTVHDYRLICPAYTFRNGAGKICEKCGDGSFWHCFTNNCCKGNRLYSAAMAAEQYYRNAYYNPTDYIDGLIYVSDFARELHHRYLPDSKSIKSIRLYNFTNDLHMRSFGDSAERYFLYFGRLSAEKGVSTLIKAFSQMPEYRLKIVGTGPDESMLKKYVSEHGLTNIEFTGYKRGTDLSQIIAEAYFTIIPSEWYENNPMSVIESFSHGVPVIGANIAGIPEIVIDGDTGYTFKSGDTQSLAETLMKAYALDQMAYTKLSHNAFDFASKNFNSNTYFTQLIQFYGSVIQTSKHSRDSRHKDKKNFSRGGDSRHKDIF